MSIKANYWAETEFAQRDLGDARRANRARTRMERFATDPAARVPQACHNWGETMAAYRFFDNDRVDWHARHPVKKTCLKKLSAVPHKDADTQPGVVPVNFAPRR